MSQRQNWNKKLCALQQSRWFGSLSSILKVSIFSEAYLESSRTSMMKLFAKIAESRSLFLQKSSMLDWVLNMALLLQTLSQLSRLFKVFYFFKELLRFKFGKKYTLKICLDTLNKKMVISIEPHKIWRGNKIKFEPIKVELKLKEDFISISI